jgi:hypothetical protein
MASIIPAKNVEVYQRFCGIHDKYIEMSSLKFKKMFTQEHKNTIFNFNRLLLQYRSY